MLTYGKSAYSHHQQLWLSVNCILKSLVIAVEKLSSLRNWAAKSPSLQSQKASTERKDRKMITLICDAKPSRKPPAGRLQYCSSTPLPGQSPLTLSAFFQKMVFTISPKLHEFLSSAPGRQPKLQSCTSSAGGGGKTARCCSKEHLATPVFVQGCRRADHFGFILLEEMF